MTRSREQRFYGIPAAGGVVVAPAFVIPSPWAAEAVPPPQPLSPQEERERLQRALEQARAAIRRLHQQALERVGKKEAAIFQVHEMFLQDATLLRAVEEGLEAGRSALEAWKQAIETQAHLLEALHDPVFSARAVDLRDVGQRVARLLSGQGEEMPLPEVPSVVLAFELTPSQTILLPKERVRGFGTVQGNRTSHVAILARGLGLPAVVGLPPELLERVRTGQPIVLDGDAGVVVVEPEEATVRAALQRAQARARRRAVSQAQSAQPATTPDGRRVEIGANLGGGGEEEAQRALALGAEGVGLLRTEFLYMERSSPPDEEEQVAAYAAYLRAFAPRPVIFRTVDIGGDKALPYLDLPAEDNPFLGQRGIRLTLAHPDLFRTQLRAILRAGAGTQGVVKIMFPMVATLEEVRQAKAHLAAVQRALEEEGVPYAQGVEVGIMVEIPAAAVLADGLASEVDFFSIGTNDLAQYTLAADRTHPQVGQLADALHPAVLRLIAQVVRAAHEAGLWVGVCGELAGDPTATPVLVGLGVDELSMAAPVIPEVKAQVRRWTYAQAQGVAQRALALSSAQAVREMLAEAHGGQ